MKNHETHEFPRKVESGAALGQAKLALRFQIPLQANLHGILKTRHPLAPREVLLFRALPDMKNLQKLAFRKARDKARQAGRRSF